MRLDTRKKRLLKKNIQTLSLTGGGLDPSNDVVRRCTRQS